MTLKLLSNAGSPIDAGAAFFPAYFTSTTQWVDEGGCAYDYAQGSEATLTETALWNNGVNDSRPGQGGL